MKEGAFHPFVIWTFQRTGGTSLAVALELSSSAGKVLHEPFNPDRELASIARAARIGRTELARTELRAVFQAGTCLKHCFELRSRALSRLMIEVLADFRAYRHILLRRGSETDRLASLFLARQTAVWGKWKEKKGGYDEFLDGSQALEPFPLEAMIEHGRHCQAQLAWLESELSAAGIPVLETDYETLYQGEPAKRREAFTRVFDYVGRPLDMQNEKIAARLFSSKQGSERLLSRVPNIDEVRMRLPQALKTG